MTRLAELRRAADCCRDVVAHAREGIAAAGPGFILVVAGDDAAAFHKYFTQAIAPGICII
jgi:hypothetical protein